MVTLGPEEWRGLIDYWQKAGHDIRHLDIPEDVARQLGVELPKKEDDMTAEHEPLGAQWKRKKYFDGTTCGLKDCKHAADGYVCDLKPTKEGGKGRLWFGPACTKCVRKTHPTLNPMSLAELAHQRNGASDLALVLDVEVGDILKRLEAAGIDEKGRPLEGAQPALQAKQTVIPGTEAPQAPPPSAAPQTPLVTPPPQDASPPPNYIVVQVDSVQIPAQYLEAQVVDARTIRERFVDPLVIADQASMDLASNYTKLIKKSWNQLDEYRKSLTKPLRDKIEEIQAYFNPPLEKLKEAEDLLKRKISEGAHAMARAQASALQAAQAAFQQQNPAALAAASQQATQADVSLSPGVSIRKLKRWAIQDPSRVPFELWSPDAAKIQQAIDLGHTYIPGIAIWEEDSVAVRQ